MAVIQVTEDNFDEVVMKSEKPVLLDFYADWCGPCKMMAPIVKELADKFAGKCKVGKCNIDENLKVAQNYRVMSIPTFIVFKNGEVVVTAIGAMSKNDLESKINAVL